MNNIKIREREEKRRLKRLQKINDMNDIIKKNKQKELLKNIEILKNNEIRKSRDLSIKKKDDEKLLKRLERIKLKNEKKEEEKKQRIKLYHEKLELKKLMDSKKVINPVKKRRKEENKKKIKKIRKKNKNKNHNTIFYICSFGGCGGNKLSKYLGNFGEVHEINTRKPPIFLTKKNSNWFGPEIVKNENIKFYHVIYLYRNPLDAMNIQTFNSSHLKKIQLQNIHLRIDDIINTGKDYYHLNTFFNNYAKEPISEKKKRNYKIICMKYESIFDKNSIEELNKILNIDRNFSNLYPVEEKPSFDKYSKNESLIKAYKKLNGQIELMPMLKIV